MGRPRKIKASHLANAAGVSPAAISKSRLLTHNLDGSIDVDASIETVASLEVSQARKEAALAEIREMERDQMRGNLVDVGEMERSWATVGRVLRDAFLALPEQIAPQVAALSDRIAVRDVLRGEVHRILANLPAQIQERGDGQQNAREEKKHDEKFKRRS